MSRHIDYPRPMTAVPSTSPVDITPDVQPRGGPQNAPARQGTPDPGGRAQLQRPPVEPKPLPVQGPVKGGDNAGSTR